MVDGGTLQYSMHPLPGQPAQRYRRGWVGVGWGGYTATLICTLTTIQYTVAKECVARRQAEALAFGGLGAALLLQLGAVQHVLPAAARMQQEHRRKRNSNRHALLRLHAVQHELHCKSAAADTATAAAKQLRGLTCTEHMEHAVELGW